MDLLLAAVERGDISDSAWDHIEVRLFGKGRLLSDFVSAYYAHPSAWSAIGFGGPASPRGYVRLAANMRDSWEAVERAEKTTVLAMRGIVEIWRREMAGHGSVLSAQSPHAAYCDSLATISWRWR